MTRAHFAVAVLLVGAGACADTNRTITPPESIDAELRQAISQTYGVVPIAAMPAQDPAQVALGRALFFDKILSGNKDIACATCHLPQQHLQDGLSLAIGTGGSGEGPARTLGAGRQFHQRSAPSLLNDGLGLVYVFDDGRVSGFRSGPFQTPAGTALPSVPNILAAQAMFPVLNRQEMRGDSGDVDSLGAPNELAQFGDSQLTDIWQGVMQRLLAIPEYVTLFHAAFPGTPDSQLGFQHAAAAIAAFELQEFTKTNSPFDHYLAREDAALTATEKRGALLFFGKAKCASCHNGPLLGSEGFANTGAPQLGPGMGSAEPLDLGRGELPNNDFYKFAFRIAPLRNVELTAPYFHDGVYPTLEAVVRHYNDVPTALRTYDVTQVAPELRSQYHGGDAVTSQILTTLDFRLQQPLKLTPAEQSDLVAFLKSLTDPAARDLTPIVPARVPSGLTVP
ncbi:MAG TPA: cytochrome c peroxidase [Gemmatimonadales bacterium]